MMRVTQRSIRRNYLTSLNRNASQLADSTQKMNSGRKFSRISENVTDGSRAFKLRRQIAQNEQYVVNIEDMRNELKTAEKGILDISSIINSIQEKMVQGNNSATLSQTEMTLIGNEIDNLKDNIIQIINSKNVDRFTFAGSENTTPMVFDGADWTFNGIAVDSADRADFGDASRFLDIGFGMTFLADGSVDKNTVSQLSTAAVDILGHGTTTIDGKPVPNNLISLVEKIANDFKAGNMADLQTNLGHIQTRQNDLLIQVGDVGNRAKFLDDNQDRIESELIDLKTSQVKIEAVNIEEESIYNSSYLMAWQVSLKLASSILPQSIFDFMN